MFGRKTRKLNRQERQKLSADKRLKLCLAELPETIGPERAKEITTRTVIALQTRRALDITGIRDEKKRHRIHKIVQKLEERYGELRAAHKLHTKSDILKAANDSVINRCMGELWEEIGGLGKTMEFEVCRRILWPKLKVEKRAPKK